MNEYRSVNFQNHRIDTTDESGRTIGKILEITSTGAAVKTVPGILQSGDGIEPGGFDNELVSFQAVDASGNPTSPPRYLRPQANASQVERVLVLEAVPTSAEAQRQFRKEATFQVVSPLYTFSGQNNDELVSFKSITIGPATLNEGAFIRHFHYRLLVTDHTVNPSVFAQDATFIRQSQANVSRVTYEVGDIHPNGGIVFAVDRTGEHGWVVMPEDLGEYSFSDAIAAAREYKGGGWALPSIGQLLEIYEELHVDLGMGDFQSAVYRSGTSSGYPQYPWALNFGNGVKAGDGLGNTTKVRLVTSF